MKDSITDLELFENASEDLKLYEGGPVGTDMLHFLHMYHDLVNESSSIDGNLCVGGNVEEIQYIASNFEYPHLRIFIGCAGWGPGQLAEELFDDSWLVSKSNRKILFERDLGTLWRDLIVQRGEEYALLINYPQNPRLN